MDLWGKEKKLIVNVLKLIIIHIKRLYNYPKKWGVSTRNRKQWATGAEEKCKMHCKSQRFPEVGINFYRFYIRLGEFLKLPHCKENLEGKEIKKRSMCFVHISICFWWKAHSLTDCGRRCGSRSLCWRKRALILFLQNAAVVIFCQVPGLM